MTVQWHISQAARRWRSRPLFAIAVTVTLGMGIGVACAMFSVVDKVLLRPLPWPQPDSLVQVSVARPHWQLDPVLSGSWNSGSVSWPIFKGLAALRDTFDTVGTYSTPRPLVESDRSEIVDGMQISASFLPMLGIAPQAGRFFTEAEDEAATDSVLIGAEAWRRRFGARSDIVGQPVTIDSIRRTVVGVVPEGFRFAGNSPPEFYLPWGNLPVSQRGPGNHFMKAIGRLRDGVSADAAQDASTPVVRGDEPPDRKRAAVQYLAEAERAEARRPLYMLLAASGLLLLITCTNVAGLLMMEVTARRQELAIRAAIGADRRSLMQQFFAESMLLGGAAALLGLVIAHWTLRGLAVLAPAEVRGGVEVATIDARVLLAASAIAMATAFVFGLLPYRTISSATAAWNGLRSGARGGERRWGRSQRIAVTTQVGLTIVLVIAATLLAETVLRLNSVPTGFRPDGLAVVTVRFPAAPAVPPPARPARTASIIETLRSVSAVESVAGVSTAPFSGGAGSSSITIGSATQRDANPVALRQIVTDGYFETLGIPIQKGRSFNPSDVPGAFAAVVSAEFERRLFGGDALGGRFNLNGNDHEVIGVAGNVLHRGFAEESGPMFYVLHRQLPQWPVTSFVVRSRIDPAETVQTLRTALEREHPRVAIAAISTMPATMARTIADQRYRARLALAFAAAAALLACVGIYALVARAVAARAHEFAVRSALGATPFATLRLVITDGLRLAAMGMIVGLPLGYLAGRAMQSMLFGVSATRAHPFIIAVLALGSVTVLAAMLPARRASRVDPVTAFRQA